MLKEINKDQAIPIAQSTTTTQNDNSLTTNNPTQAPKETLAKSKSTKIKDLEPIDISSIDIVSAADNSINDLKLPEVKTKHTKGFHIGMFSSINFDFANTLFKSFNKRKDWTPGYGTGLSMGWKKGNWEWETGISYSAKSYNPVSVKEITGSLNTGYVNETQGTIELDMIHIPINVQRHFSIASKWDIYSSIGASFNFSANTIDNLQYNSFDPSQKIAAIAPGTDPVSAISVYNPGVLEPYGSLKNNFYFTTNFGVGLEYRPNRRFSIFLQPSYQLHVGGYGIGQNQDTINTLSWFLGTKVRL